jgi:acyl-CoA synthetase (AMP-forming)/AMP-acid ligase II
MKSFFKDLEYFSDSIALTTQSEQITYSALIDEIKALSMHIRNRDLVFLICENSIESIVGYLTCLREGYIPLLIGSSIDEILLQDLIKTYKPSYIWTNRNFEWVLDDSLKIVLWSSLTNGRRWRSN